MVSPKDMRGQAGGRQDVVTKERDEEIDQYLYREEEPPRPRNIQIIEDEEEEEDEDDILDELVLEPFDYNASQMRSFFNIEYKPQLGKQFLQTFNCEIDDLIQTANSGPDSCWLQIKSNNKLVGMCVYNLDLTQYAFRRINLLHISMKQMGQFSKALKSSLKYILMHDNCTQIYCSLK